MSRWDWAVVAPQRTRIMHADKGLTRETSAIVFLATFNSVFGIQEWKSGTQEWD